MLGFADSSLACRQAFGELPPDVARFADGAAAQGGILFSTLSDFATQVHLETLSLLEHHPLWWEQTLIICLKAACLLLCNSSQAYEQAESPARPSGDFILLFCANVIHGLIRAAICSAACTYNQLSDSVGISSSKTGGFKFHVISGLSS